MILISYVIFSIFCKFVDSMHLIVSLRYQYHNNILTKQIDCWLIHQNEEEFIDNHLVS